MSDPAPLVQEARPPVRSMADLATKALQSAFTKLVLERRKENETLVLWQDGKVCHVPAREIKLPGE